MTSLSLGLHTSSAAREKTETKTPRLELYGQQHRDRENSLMPRSASRKKEPDEVWCWSQCVVQYQASTPRSLSRSMRVVGGGIKRGVVMLTGLVIGLWLFPLSTDARIPMARSGERDEVRVYPSWLRVKVRDWTWLCPR